MKSRRFMTVLSFPCVSGDQLMRCEPASIVGTILSAWTMLGKAITRAGTPGSRSLIFRRVRLDVEALIYRREHLIES
jgi:hypothetical protein